MKKITLEVEDNEVFDAETIANRCKEAFGWKKYELDPKNGTLAYCDSAGNWYCIENLREGMSFDEDGNAHEVIPFDMVVEGRVSGWAMDDTGHWVYLALG